MPARDLAGRRDRRRGRETSRLQRNDIRQSRLRAPRARPHRLEPRLRSPQKPAKRARRLRGALSGSRGCRLRHRRPPLPALRAQPPPSTLRRAARPFLPRDRRRLVGPPQPWRARRQAQPRSRVRLACHDAALQTWSAPSSTSSSKPRATRSTSAATAASASLPDARKCKSVPLAAFTRMILTGLLASTHGPSCSSASSNVAAKLLASWVSLTAGRACRPTSLVRSAEATTGVSVMLMKTILAPCHPATAYCGDSSSATRFTISSGEPPDASVAAITAPSTIGALHTATRPRRFSSSISTAISLLVSAPPRSTSMTTPAGVQARSIAARMAATSVPKPPSTLPPVKARGTAPPTIWRTMSAAPSATLLECETMTTPTCAAVLRVMASGSDRIADGRNHQRRGSRARIEVPDRTLAQKRRAAADRLHRPGRLGGGERFRPHPGTEPLAARTQHGGDRDQHVEHRLLPGLRFAARLHRFDRSSKGLGERCRRRHVRHRLAEREEKSPVEGSRRAADLHHESRPHPLQSFGQRLGRCGRQRLEDGLEAALHVEAVVAVADLPIELGQFLRMSDDRPCHRLDQSFAHCLVHEVLIRPVVSPPRVCQRHRRKAAVSPRWRPSRRLRGLSRHRSASRNRARQARHGGGPDRPNARSTKRFPESGRSPPCGCARARCARRRSPPRPAPAYLERSRAARG